MKDTRHIKALKYAVYAILLLIFYILQITPGLFVAFGHKPMIVVPFAIAAAMYEGEVAGGILGAFAGLLCDMGGSMLFGLNGIFLSLFCIAAGLTVIHLMHCNFGSAILFTFIAIFAMGGAEFVFGYAMWGHQGVWKIFLYRTLPAVAYTTLLSPVLFMAAKKLHFAFEKRIHPNKNF